jgi:hypothetical protein
VKEECEAYRFSRNDSEHDLGIWPRSKQRRPQSLFTRDHLVREVLEFGEFADKVEHEPNFTLDGRAHRDFALH